MSVLIQCLRTVRGEVSLVTASQDLPVAAIPENIEGSRLRRFITCETDHPGLTGLRQSTSGGEAAKA